MVSARRWPAVLPAIVAMGVAACTAATPPPSGPSASPEPTPGSSPGASATSAPGPTSSAIVPEIGGDLRDEIEVVSIDPDLTHPILEFRSDGQAIVFSSGREPDTGPDGAPDLWRIVPPGAEPELLWRNPERNHSIVGIAADLGSYAFVEMPLTGERAWNLWLLPRGAESAILLDTHPGNEAVPSAVPSIAVHESTVVWTAFDRGPDGPVSQLRIAQGPDWEQRVIHELPAAEAEIWLPSLLGSTLAYMEVHYRDGRSTDERHVFLTGIEPGAERRRLDGSGLATMPVVVDGAVLWKEADPGFSMFNWGRMYRYDLATETVRRLRTSPQQFVNYPSAGSRFAAWWGSDSFQLGVYDLLLYEPRLVARHPIASQQSELEPHVAGDLLVWRHADLLDPDDPGELRYAFLPPLREP